MYTLYEFTNFSQQKVSMPDTERNSLNGVLSALRGLPNLAGQTAVNDQATILGAFKPAGTAPNDKIRQKQLYCRTIPMTPDFVYFCESPVQKQGGAPTLALISIGHKTAMGFSEYFGDWNLASRPEEWQKVFAGTWTADFNNTIDMNSQERLIFAHNDKHFGAMPREAQYEIGTTATRKRIVAGMEKKAVDHGMILSGEAFFKFNVNVGHDGTHPTRCIRVDTPGIPTQHSHPIPEMGEGEVNHNDKVFYALKYYTDILHLENLLRLAKYLKVIGAVEGSYVPPQNSRSQFKLRKPPKCIYWSW